MATHQIKRHSRLGPATAALTKHPEPRSKTSKNTSQISENSEEEEEKQEKVLGISGHLPKEGTLERVYEVP